RLVVAARPGLAVAQGLPDGDLVAAALGLGREDLERAGEEAHGDGVLAALAGAEAALDRDRVRARRVAGREPVEGEVEEDVLAAAGPRFERVGEAAVGLAH